MFVSLLGLSLSMMLSPLLFYYFADASQVVKFDSRNKPVLQIGTALTVSFAICKAATSFSRFFGTQGCDLPAITAIVVLLATAFPAYFRNLASAGDEIAIVLMQVIELPQYCYSTLLLE